MTTAATFPDVPKPDDSNQGAPPGVSRFVIGLAVAGNILLALGAFWLSFTALRDLAVLAGLPEGQAWIWPLIVDGVILEATVSVVALRNSSPAARRFAWLLLAAGSGVSVAANITHAVLDADDRIPALIAALVASVPPLVLLAMTHLTVELTRNSTPHRTAPNSPGPVPMTDAISPARTPERVSHSSPAPLLLGATSLAVRALSAPPIPRPAEMTAGTAGDPRARALAMHAGGASKRQIAADLGVHPTTVGRWLNTPDQRQNGDPHD